jgi:hypothetical protein
MKKFILFTLLGLAAIGFSNAQSWVFAEQFASTGNVEPIDIKVDGNGDVYIVGNFIGDLTIGGLAPLIYSGVAEDIFLCKFNEDGLALWAHRIGGDSTDVVGGLAIDPGNDVYVVGGFRSTTLSFGGGTATLTQTNHYDAFLARYNGSGVLQYANSVFYGADVERLLDVEYDFTNDLVVVVGQFKTEVKYDDGGEQTIAVTGPSTKNHILARFGPDGTFIDIQTFYGSHQQSAFKNVNNSIVGGDVDGYFATGDIRGTMWFSPTDSVVGRTSAMDILVARFGDDLAYDWSRTGGGTGFDHINSSGSDGFGNIYFTGKAESTTIVIDSTATMSSAPRPTLGLSDFLIAKYNRVGNLQWFRRDGGIGSDNAYGLSVLNRRILYSGTIDEGGNVQSGFAVYDIDGNLIATDQITGDGIETGLNVAFDQTGDSTFVIGSFDGDALMAGPVLQLDNTASGLTDGFFVKYGFKFSVYEEDKENILCNGDTTGSIVVATQFGTEPITYEWIPSVSTGPSATNLPAGEYKIIATDAGLRKDSVVITLTELPPIMITSGTIVPTSCHTSSTSGTKNDGKVFMSVSGGTLPLSFLWSPSGETTEDIAAAIAGANTVTITDGMGCVKDTTFMVPQPDSISFAGSTVDTIKIPPGSNGAVNLNVQGGTPVYTYAWTGPSGYSSTDASITGLANQGLYDLSLTDGNDCVQDTSFNVPSDTGLSIIICDLIDITCKGNEDGEAEVCVEFGGTGSYTYAWRTVMGVPVGLDQARITGFAPGTYIVRVTDNGNAKYAEVSFEINEPALPLQVVTDSVWNVSCPGDNDGAIFISVAGGWGPAAFSWSPGGAVTQDVTGVTAGAYMVTVTDSGGCVIQYSDTVRSPVALFVVVDVQTPVCGENLGALIVNVTGGTEPYAYVWDDPGAQTTQIATNLEVGPYMVAVTDAKGCMENGTGMLSAPSVPSIVSLVETWDEGEEIGTITINVAGGSPSYTYSLSGGNNDTIAESTVSELYYTFTSLVGGDYDISVVDGCDVQIDTNFLALTIEDLQLGYDLLLYPNPSTGQFTVEMDNPEREDIDLEIINLMGQRIFRQKYESFGEARFIQTLDLGNQASGAYFMRINGMPVKAKLMIE